jgi:hypothetical protein
MDGRSKVAFDAAALQLGFPCYPRCSSAADAQNLDLPYR